MRIKNRLFPYPVLNNDKRLSDYKEDLYFELSFNNKQEVLVDDSIYLKDVYLKTNDKYLSSLLEKGRIKGALIVECSSTVFREKYEITNEPEDIIIPSDLFNNDIEISAFVYAVEDIDEYSDSGFLEDYAGLRFRIEKYCILAADDGFAIKINKQPETESKKSSIFTIVCDYTHDDDIIRYSMSNRKIIISLPEKHYQSYNAVKYNEKFLNASFATIAIPVLIECLEEIKKLVGQSEEKSLVDICFEYPWFRSVCDAYKREKGVELTEDLLLNEMTPFDLAQIVFDCASCGSLTDIRSVVEKQIIIRTRRTSNEEYKY